MLHLDTEILKAISCGINKAASVHNHKIRVFIGRTNEVAFGPEFGNNTLAVDKSFRAAERDESNTGRTFSHLFTSKEVV